jgi:hypothetical protein
LRQTLTLSPEQSTLATSCLLCAFVKDALCRLHRPFVVIFKSLGAIKVAFSKLHVHRRGLWQKLAAGVLAVKNKKSITLKKKSITRLLLLLLMMMMKSS